ncbi:integral membrane sensor domain MASE1 [Peribacillus deserti]|uniref:Integral membrane sensor domain MASE1 n=1 Tax=Peribacillus deserti TaxID=673318 RepID=A0ABS2QI17_9BACI|nr:hypothetical protein [Peribacillus deserti]MBM7692821.1 integral membrane sensor domain MASE1 [Peribacillus deserti]
MNLNNNFLKAVTYVAAPILMIGIAIFLKGFFENGSSVWTPIGIGAIIGAIFIFIMGMFMVATEEVLEKSYKGKKLIMIKNKKGAPL